MNAIKQSYILGIIAAFLALLEKKYLESAFHNVFVRGVILPLWKIVERKWDESLCMAILRGIGNVFMSGISFAFFTRRPVFDKALEQSRLTAVLVWCANLVPMLLGKLHCRFPKLLNGSLIWSVLEKLTLPVLCAMILFMFVMPQEYWNNMYSLVFAVTALLLFWISGVRDETKRLSLRGLGGWTVVFFAVTLASTFWSLDFGTSIRYMAFWITSFIVIAVLVSLVKSERQLMAIVSCMAIGLLVASGYAVMQRLGGLEASEVLSDMSLNEGMPGRVYSFFENPNSFFRLWFDGKHPWCANRCLNDIIFQIEFLQNCEIKLFIFSKPIYKILCNDIANTINSSQFFWISNILQELLRILFTNSFHIRANQLHRIITYIGNTQRSNKTVECGFL
ncbi:MAG: hypothetical protein IKZ30_00155 [Oscillospiraceae bacterium]|nr:hypothetical protein [Oscillospiraceae bacterium]